MNTRHRWPGRHRIPALQARVHLLRQLIHSETMTAKRAALEADLRDTLRLIDAPPVETPPRPLARFAC